MPPKAAPVAVAAAGGAGAPPPADEGFFKSPLFKTIARSVAIYVGINLLIGPNSPFRTKTNKVEITPPAGGQVETSKVDQSVTPAVAIPSLEAVSLWPEGTLLDVAIKLSTAEDGKVDWKDTSLPSVTWEGVEYANSNWEKVWDTHWDVPVSVQHNASIWADIFVSRTGVSPDPSASNYGDPADILHVRKLLTRYYQLKRVREVKNLISSLKSNETAPPPPKEEAPEEKKEQPIIAYYHQNLTVTITIPPPMIDWTAMPPPLQTLINIAHPEERTHDGKATFFPITWANDFWLLREHMHPINETTTRLPLRVSLVPSGFWKFQILASLEDTMSKQAATTGGGGAELDIIKRTLTETSVWLLLATAAVTVLHMLFEFLAFTSDISHWRGKKEMVGVSVRTIITNVVVQAIILLYLIDNNENTSYMILGGQGIGLVIEAWKITKAVDIAVIPAPAGSIIPYTLKITDKHVLSEDELKTQEFDQLAFRWVGYGTAPLLVGYTIYSMFYNEHRSWYSFTIATLTSFVYAFGFIQLVPQLIINYKLKSVAHLPMKTLTYKALNTVVDDFFSFVIKRADARCAGCLSFIVWRASGMMVFVILLYQMWIYKVDPTRVNEYGQQLSEAEAERLLEEQKIKDAAAKGITIESKKDQ